MLQRNEKRRNSGGRAMGTGNSARQTARSRDGDLIDFGEVPPAVNEILQEGVALYRHDRTRADMAFRRALALDPRALATYFCLYKIHTYSGDLDAALAIAEAAVTEAARQANLSPDWHLWDPAEITLHGPGRFALYTLKAQAFIRLRRDEPREARALLDALARLDPTDAVGASVVRALAQGVG